jgi:hypothetical protein
VWHVQRLCVLQHCVKADAVRVPNSIIRDHSGIIEEGSVAFHMPFSS